MKTQSFLLLATAAALLAANSALAQYQPASYDNNDNSDELGFRLGASAGVSVMQDFDSARFGFPGRFSTRPGGEVVAAPEYDFLSIRNLTLGADFETGLAYNEIKRINDGGVETYAHGEYYQVPIIAGLLLKLPIGSFVTPYIGLGGGGDYSELRIHSSYYFGSHERSDEIDPAVQATAGVLFRLNRASQLGLSYQMLAALPGSNENTFTHAVMATFNFQF